MTYETLSHFVNVDEVRKAIKILHKQDGVFEIRIIHTAKKNDVYSGYFRDTDAMLRALQSIDQRREYPYNRFTLEKRNIYITLNRLKEDCFSRSQSECFEFNPSTTSDPDITEYQWLFVDADPERTKGISSSKEELQAAKDMAKKIYLYMQALGFKEPVKAMSGNGCHLLYRISVPNDEAGKNLIERCLKVLSELFTTNEVKIDTTTSNPSRICKLHGTLAQKGKNTGDRPHRMSYIFSEDSEPKITPIEILQKLAAELPEEQYDIRNLTLEENCRKRSGTKAPFDLESFLARNGLTYTKGKTDRAVKYLLDECPFDPSHQHGDARIFLYDNGAIAFKCHHNSCSSYRWQDVRLKYEPDAYSYEERKPEKKTAAGQDQEQSGAPHKLPRKMADVEKKEVSWLIPGYIPLNAITVIAGDGGAGKTTVETDIVASVSSGGRPFLLGFPVLTERDRKGPGGNVLLMSGEDYAAYTLRDKVEKADGDMEKVYVVDPSDADIKDYIIGGRVLEDAVREIRPKLVVIDPLQSFLDKEVNMIARNEIRQALMPLASLAENYGFACMIAAHSNKRDSASGRNRVSDSSDIWDIARSVLMIGFTQEEGVRYLSHEKSNWGSYADTVLFRIEDDGRPHFMRYTKQKDSDFQNEKRKTASDTKAAPKREEAEAFILEYLQHSEGGMSAWNSIAKAGKCEGISDATMKGARDSLKDAKRIKSTWRGKTGKGKGTECYWMLDSGYNINDLELDENE